MTDRWLTENWTQFMSGADELLQDIRRNAEQLGNDTVRTLLEQAEEQRIAAEATLRAFSEQRQALLQTLDALQSELAVAGRPLPGEVS
ncbi:MAG: hypothetical protein M3R24_15720 [Chloroflexota bacterium]|nr:hypothetical protein [Chloroflexota bacterium]PLS78389.1 MAG: hypothetical protein CYG59_18755 [Chloroflexota bacterium]